MRTIRNISKVADDKSAVTNTLLFATEVNDDDTAWRLRTVIANSNGTVITSSTLAREDGTGDVYAQGDWSTKDLDATQIPKFLRNIFVYAHLVDAGLVDEGIIYTNKFDDDKKRATDTGAKQFVDTSVMTDEERNAFGKRLYQWEVDATEFLEEEIMGSLL